MFVYEKNKMLSIREILRLIETNDFIPVLYHGTCIENAKSLIKNGWSPRSGSMGGNMGQSKYLYLTTDPEDAMWFANEKGCDTVISLHNVPKNFLIVDPEDGTYDTVDEELNSKHGFPGKVALTKYLGSEHFKLFKGEE